MNKKKNIKQYFKDLLFSLFDTASLLKFGIYNWVAPLIVLIITVAIMVCPSIIVYNTLDASDITTNVIHLDNVIADVLSKGQFNCAVEDGKLNCAETYSFYDYSYIDEKDTSTSEDDITITYRVYVNSSISETPKVEGYATPLATDNYLILSKNSFMYRYTYRDPVSKTVTEYSLVSLYDNLEGIDFNEIHQTYLSYQDSTEAYNYLLDKANTIIVEGYKVVAYEAIYTNLVASIGSYLLFVIVASLLIKGNYLLKKNKGFKITQSIKITLVASMQSLIIAIVLSLSGIDFVNALGLTLAVRVLYIYIRYTGSKKNTKWLENLYTETKDERFNITQ